MQNRNKENTVKTPAYHRARFFGKSVVIGACVPLPLLPLGLISGSIHGTHRAYTRKPIKHDEIITVTNKLCALLDNPKLESMFNDIAKLYTDTRSIASSASSNELLTVLQSDKISTYDKLSKVIDYMNCFDEKYFNKNNGKKLFNIIVAQVEAIMPSPARAEASSQQRHAIRR